MQIYISHDTNALYLGTMLLDMPYSKEKETDYEDPIQAAIKLKNVVTAEELFGFVKCRLATPKNCAKVKIMN